MSTKSHSHKTVHAKSPEITVHEKSTVVSPAEQTAATIPSAAIVESAPAATAATGAQPAPAAPVVFVSGPPSNVNIPTVEYAPASPGEFKTVVPRTQELTALSQALKDLAAFTSYQQTLGTSAPAYAEVVQAFTVGAQWTSMRTLASSWDGYCVVQQGLAWRAIRQLMAQLVPVFALAVTANPKLLTQYPGLASLLGAKKAIAQKGASTKQANKKAKAEGKPETHGAVGKRNQRRYEKELAAQAQAAAQAPASPVQPVVPQPAPVAPAAGGSTPAAVNGAAH